MTTAGPGVGYVAGLQPSTRCRAAKHREYVTLNSRSFQVQCSMLRHQEAGVVSQVQRSTRCCVPLSPVRFPQFITTVSLTFQLLRGMDIDRDAIFHSDHGAAVFGAAMPPKASWNASRRSSRKVLKCPGIQASVFGLLLLLPARLAHLVSRTDATWWCHDTVIFLLDDD